MTPEERLFDKKCREQGWIPHNSGWPDRWIEKDGAVVFVEIKYVRDRVRRNQIETLQMLESCGLRVGIWEGGELDHIVPLDMYLRGERSGNVQKLPRKEWKLELKLQNEAMDKLVVLANEELAKQGGNDEGHKSATDVIGEVGGDHKL